MKLSFNYSNIKNGRLGFSIEECLTEDEANKVKNLDLNNLIDLDRNERLNALMSVVNEDKANMVNSHLEKDIILKRQKDGIIKIFNEMDIGSKWRKEVNRKISDLEKALDKKELDDFIEELVEIKNGVGLGFMTLKQAEKILYDEYAEFLQSDTTRFGAICPITPSVSFHPYHPKYIKEAIGILKAYCKKNGDTSKIETIEGVEPFLWNIKDDEECMFKLVEDSKWRDLSFKLIKKFQENPNQVSYVAKYLEDEPFDTIDFNNLNINIAKKLSKVINLFFKNSYLLLNITFGSKVPESLLPFNKIKVLKLIDFMILSSNSTNNKEEAEAYTFMKNYITNEYINDETAMEEFIKNISDKEIRNSIISNLENHQFEKIQKLLSE